MRFPLFLKSFFVKSSKLQRKKQSTKLLLGVMLISYLSLDKSVDMFVDLILARSSLIFHLKCPRKLKLRFSTNCDQTNRTFQSFGVLKIFPIFRIILKTLSF